MAVNTDTNSDVIAKELFDSLSNDITISLPDVNLNDPKYDLGNTDNNPL